MLDEDAEDAAPIVPGSPRQRVLEALTAAFPGLDGAAMATSLTVRTLAPGEVLCEEGDAADVAWLVVGGRLRVSRRRGPAPVEVLGDAEAGEVIGEQALVDGGVRQARVMAVRASTVAVLDRQWFAALVRDDPGAVGRLLAAVDRRARSPHERRERVVAIVPGVAGRDRLERLVERLRALPDVAVVDAASPVAARVGDDTDWLSAMEEDHDRVVLVADPTWNAWTDAVTRAADLVAVVVDGGSAPAVSAVEARLDALPDELDQRHVLVLLHPADTARPTGTAAHLDVRTAALALHARIDRDGDLDRVARHLTGRAVALVVGGGGARSLAAIGAFRELRKRGVAVDAVVGSSGGAVIGAGIAQGRDPEETRADARRGFLKVNDPTIPAASLLRGRRLWDRMAEHLGEGDIEDTWIPFACVSTDLTSGDLAVHRRGSLRDRVRASLSVPGVLLPVDIDGHLHVDGGLLDNLPVRAARELTPEATVIALDFSLPAGPDAPQPIPRSASGWRWLVAKAIPGREAPKVPSIVTTVMQSVVLSASRARAESLALIDLHVDYDLHDFALLDFNRIDRIIDVGARQTAPVLDDWLAGAGRRVDRSDAWTPPASMASIIDPELAPSRRRAFTGALFLAAADLRHRLKRFVVAVVAASVVLALLLLMTGVVGQLEREPEVTMDAIGATHWVLPEGIESPFTSNATFGPEVAAAVEVTGDARPALLARLPVTVDGETIDAILLGHAAGGPGEPTASAGRAAEAPGEAAIASFAGADVGDTVLLGSRPTTVVGELDDATLFAGMPLVFVTLDDARALVAGGRDVTSTVLVDGTVESVPDGLHVLDRSQVVVEAKNPVERPILTLHLVRVLLAVVAAMIIGAVVYLASIERHRDMAVLRAVGTDKSMLAVGVAAQALAMALVAAVVATGLQVLLAPVFPLTIHLTVLDRVLLLVIAAIVAVLASYAAVRRVLTIDPSAAFAGPEG